jgi:lipid II:glycine glycyltransferase (peptidoglycan interpeptide bridge formation enzyme)
VGLLLKPAGLDICANADTFLQSELWGRFKERFGWKAFAFSCGYENEEQPLLVLFRRLNALFSFAYVPWGPRLPAGVNGAEVQNYLLQVAVELRKQLPPATAFIRFDPPWYTANTAELSAPFTRSAADVQPPDSVLIDLGAGEEEILGGMKSKWRYNIGLAAKKGVQVRCAEASSPQFEKDLESYYRLYRETAQRDGISIHGVEYYRGLFDLAGGTEAARLRLYMASHEGEDIAGVITIFRKREAVYLYGASSSRKRNLMAPYALQWQAMRDAKKSLCAYYDLFGIPPVSPEEDPRHPMAGLYRFKTGFGGTIIHRPGSWNYRCRPLLTALFSAAEGMRKKIWTIGKRNRRT